MVTLKGFYCTKHASVIFHHMPWLKKQFQPIIYATTRRIAIILELWTRLGGLQSRLLYMHVASDFLPNAGLKYDIIIYVKRLLVFISTFHIAFILELTAPLGSRQNWLAYYHTAVIFCKVPHSVFQRFLIIYTISLRQWVLVSLATRYH